MIFLLIMWIVFSIIIFITHCIDRSIISTQDDLITILKKITENDKKIISNNEEIITIYTEAYNLQEEKIKVLQELEDDYRHRIKYLEHRLSVSSYEEIRDINQVLPDKKMSFHSDNK